MRWAIQTALALLLLGIVVAAPNAAATERKSVGEILECLQRTRPLTNTVRTIRLVSQDRVGEEHLLRGKVYGGLSRTGFRTLLLELSDPESVRGLTVLITERTGANHMFVSPAGLPDVRQIRGAPGSSNLFGTDFSYEDVERLYGLDLPSETHKLGSSETPMEGRPFWLLETTPDQETSSYERIVSLIDEETCVLVRAEMFESGFTPRKILTSNPDSVTREGSTWVARDIMIRDLRDGTQTRLVIDDVDLAAEHVGVPFTPEELEQYKRAQAKAEQK